MDARDITTRLVAGVVAGDMTVTGIQVGDTIISVQDMAAAGANLFAEFTVTADDTINNAGGTSTNGHLTLVMWHKNYKRRHKFEASAGTRQGRSPY